MSDNPSVREDVAAKLAERRREKTFSILRQLDEHKITLPQARAQLKDLSYDEWEIDIYIDGDIEGYEPS